jgi:RNA polymerase sigma factor (TIGR02999 family)
MSDPQVTQLLLRWRQGDSGAEAALMEAIYPVLRKLAQQRMSPGDQHILGATELVHEAYFRLVDQRETNYQNRAHFYAIAARMIRRVLIDQVRERGAQKRGGEQVHVSLNHALDADAPVLINADDLIDIDRLLTRLERIKERSARIVELRYFTGLSIEEAAEVCAISLATAKREWQFARAWMQDQLGATPS